MTLVEFLLARIAEDEERIARWDSDGRARVATMWTGGTPGYTTVASDHADEHWIADGREVSDPRHVTVLFDPARALAESETKRFIVGRHSENATAYPPRFDEFDPHSITVCRGCRESREPFHKPGCSTLRAMAAVYADHPDYQPEWRS